MYGHLNTNWWKEEGNKYKANMLTESVRAPNTEKKFSYICKQRLAV
jgi:hypothetical protein